MCRFYFHRKKVRRLLYSGQIVTYIQSMVLLVCFSHRTTFHLKEIFVVSFLLAPKPYNTKQIAMWKLEMNYNTILFDLTESVLRSLPALNNFVTE
jgi:hypothetical protein